MVVVPYIQKAPLKLDRVLVAWDGSHGAARAIGDAMPFLRRAKTIDIVIVSNGRTKKDEVPGVEIGHHLARHGLEGRRPATRRRGRRRGEHPSVLRGRQRRSISW